MQNFDHSTTLKPLAALILAQLTARIKTTLEQCLVISRVQCWTEQRSLLDQGQG